MVAGDVARALDRSANSYRETSLIGSTSSFVSAHRDAQRPVQFVVLERSGTGRLSKVGTPHAPVRVDADAINGLSALAELRADPFLDDATPVDETSGGASLSISPKEENHPCVQARAQQRRVRPQHRRWRRDGRTRCREARSPAQRTGCVLESVVNRIKQPASTYVDNAFTATRDRGRYRRSSRLLSNAISCCSTSNGEATAFTCAFRRPAS